GLSRWYNGNFHRGSLSSESDCDNDFHSFHCVLPFPCRSAFDPLGGSYLTPKSFQNDRKRRLAPRYPVTTAKFHITSGHQLSGFPHPSHSGVNGGHVVFVVFAKIKSHLLKELPHH